MPSEEMFRRSGDDSGFGFWRKIRSSRPPPEDRYRGGGVAYHSLPPERIVGEGILTMKQRRYPNVDTYRKIEIPSQENTFVSDRHKCQPKKSTRAHGGSLMDEDIDRPSAPSRRHSPSIVAKLMGLDPLLPPEPINAPTMEFKDVYVVTETGKGERKNRVSPQAFIKSTQRDPGVAKRISKRDLLLKFLEEPSSIVKSQRKGSSETKITILKPPSVLKSERNGSQRSKSMLDWEDDPGSLPTRIVVLKPSLQRVGQRPLGSTETVDRQYRRSGRKESLDELRDSDGTHRAKRSREIAREVTRHMKQAAEIQMTSHKQREIICPRGYSTLGEILASSDVEISEMSLSVRKKIPRGISSKDDNALRRSKSLPSSAVIYRHGIGFDHSPKHDSEALSLDKEVHVGSDQPQDIPLTGEKSSSSGSCSSSYATEKYCSVDSQQNSSTKEMSSITEETDQPSPISVLESLSESGSPPESFERLSADLRELRLKLRLLKCESVDTCSDTIISSENEDDEDAEEEDHQEREFSYLQKVLDAAGFRRGDWDEFFCGFFSPETPICRDLFEKIEKTCYSESPWRKSERKLLFDMFNLILADILVTNMELRPWVKNNCGIDRRKNVAEETWEMVCRRRREAVASSKFMENPKWLDVVDDVDWIGREVERMVRDDLLRELFFDVLSR